jgi:hypothetical protein
MVAMIGELDSVMGICECDAETAKVSSSARDSVLVSKERLLRMKEGSGERQAVQAELFRGFGYGSCC